MYASPAIGERMCSVKETGARAIIALIFELYSGRSDMATQKPAFYKDKQILIKKICTDKKIYLKNYFCARRLISQ